GTVGWSTIRVCKSMTTRAVRAIASMATASPPGALALLAGALAVAGQPLARRTKSKAVARAGSGRLPTRSCLAEPGRSEAVEGTTHGVTRPRAREGLTVTHEPRGRSRQ